MRNTSRFQITLAGMILVLSAIAITGFACGQTHRLSKVSRITVYSVDWGLTTFSRMTCDDVKTDPSSAVVSISEPDQVETFVRLLRNAHLEEQAEYDGLDVRICCQLEDKEGNVLAEVSFSYTSQMQIDDKVYLTDVSLFEFIVGYLPADYLEW